MYTRDAAPVGGLCLALLGLAVALQACVVTRGPSGPVVSPTGIVYEAGTPPRETRFSQTAALYLRSDSPERAIELALEGIDYEPHNPMHYFLAGVAYARLGQYAEADEMFVEAQDRYPAYELDIEPEREAAWAEAFNKGAEAYAEGDFEEAIHWWQGATVIYDLRPEAHRNLALLLSGEGRYEEAIDVRERALAGLDKRPATRVLDGETLRARDETKATEEESLAELFLITERYAEAEPLLQDQVDRDPSNRSVRQSLALALSGQGRHDEAGEIYYALLEEGELTGGELFDLGVAFFRSDDYDRAAEAFARLTELRPDSRDAWFNRANALFAAEAWDALLPVVYRLLELDPLNEQAGLILARTHLESGDEGAALRGLERVREASVYVEGLVMRHSGAGTSVNGRLTGNRSEPGEPVPLRFRFYDDADELGTETITLPAPASGESRVFEVSFARRATSYRYELLAEDR